MFSRVAYTAARAQPYRQLLAARYVASTPSAATATPGSLVEGPERDLKNFPRPVRPEFPGKVRLGFIPDEWFQFFYKKTGITGPYTFGVGLVTYLMSKEIYVIEHEFFGGIALAILCVIGVKKLGPKIGAFADKEIDKYEESWSSSRRDEITGNEDSVKEEKDLQWRAEGQRLLIAAKRENVYAQLEATYRERLMTAFNEVKRRLDYQVERQNIDRRIAQKHMVQWIVNNVLKSITPQQEKESLQKCIADLKALSARA